MPSKRGNRFATWWTRRTGSKRVAAGEVGSRSEPGDVPPPPHGASRSCPVPRHPAPSVVMAPHPNSTRASRWRRVHHAPHEWGREGKHEQDAQHSFEHPLFSTNRRDRLRRRCYTPLPETVLPRPLIFRRAAFGVAPDSYKPRPPNIELIRSSPIPNPAPIVSARPNPEFMKLPSIPLPACCG